jgi:hypothetical protein
VSDRFDKVMVNDEAGGIREEAVMAYMKVVLLVHYFPTGTTIGLREEGARMSEKWLEN